MVSQQTLHTHEGLTGPFVIAIVVRGTHWAPTLDSVRDKACGCDCRGLASVASGTACGLPVGSPWVCPACWSPRPACSSPTVTGPCSPHLPQRGRPHYPSFLQAPAVPPARLPMSWSTGSLCLSAPAHVGTGRTLPPGRHLRGGLALSRSERRSHWPAGGAEWTHSYTRGQRSQPITP